MAASSDREACAEGAVEPCFSIPVIAALPPINTVVQGNAARQALDGLLQPLVELRLLVIARLVQVGYPPFLDKPPGPAALVPMPGIPDAECHAARTPYQRKTGNVGIAIAHEYHLLERHTQFFLRYFFIDFKRLVARGDRKRPRLNSSH